MAGVAAVEAEEADGDGHGHGNSLLVWRSRCVMMIPKRSNLLQQLRATLSCPFPSAVLVQQRPSAVPLEHGARDLVPINNVRLHHDPFGLSLTSKKGLRVNVLLLRFVGG